MYDGSDNDSGYPTIPARTQNRNIIKMGGEWRFLMTRNVESRCGLNVKEKRCQKKLRAVFFLSVSFANYQHYTLQSQPQPQQLQPQPQPQQQQQQQQRNHTPHIMTETYQSETQPHPTWTARLQTRSPAR